MSTDAAPPHDQGTNGPRWRHFDAMAVDYARARPPYPDELYALLEAQGLVGPGKDVLEIGAGSGLATRELVARGARVVALEPGARLAEVLRREVPGACVRPQRLEDADLPTAAFDAAVAATSLHWVDLGVALPALHRALRPGGHLVSWRHVFGDPTGSSELRRRVHAAVGKGGEPHRQQAPQARPTPAELTAGGWFAPVLAESWERDLVLDAPAAELLFRTFSDWTPQEAAAVGRVVDDLGGRAVEVCRCELQVLRRTDT